MPQTFADERNYSAFDTAMVTLPSDLCFEAALRSNPRFSAQLARCDNHILYIHAHLYGSHVRQTKEWCGLLSCKAANVRGPSWARRGPVVPRPQFQYDRSKAQPRGKQTHPGTGTYPRGRIMQPRGPAKLHMIARAHCLGLHRTPKPLTCSAPRAAVGWPDTRRPA